jgi:hypothetical protein
MDKPNGVKLRTKTWDFEFRDLRSPFYGIDRKELVEFVRPGGKYSLTITQHDEWDMEPLKRRYRYVCQQFTEAYNLSQKSPCSTQFTERNVNRYLRSKYFGWRKDEHYKYWSQRYDLDFVCSNYNIWWEFRNRQFQESRFLEPEKEKTAEDLWNFLNFLEQEYYETFEEMILVKEN